MMHTPEPGSKESAEPPKYTPLDRLKLLREVAEDARLFRLGGEDKIRVATNTCETVRGTFNIVTSMEADMRTARRLRRTPRTSRPSRPCSSASSRPTSSLTSRRPLHPTATPHRTPPHQQSPAANSSTIRPRAIPDRAAPRASLARSTWFASTMT